MMPVAFGSTHGRYSQRRLVGMWLTKDMGVSRNWQMYFAIDGLVNTYAAPRRPLLMLHRPLVAFPLFQTLVNIPLGQIDGIVDTRHSMDEQTAFLHLVA
jgi:hypothetical protein